MTARARAETRRSAVRDARLKEQAKQRGEAQTEQNWATARAEMAQIAPLAEWLNELPDDDPAGVAIRAVVRAARAAGNWADSRVQAAYERAWLSLSRPARPARPCGEPMDERPVRDTSPLPRGILIPAAPAREQPRPLTTGQRQLRRLVGSPLPARRRLGVCLTCPRFFVDGSRLGDQQRHHDRACPKRAARARTRAPK
jgi:hypothetical protein